MNNKDILVLETQMAELMGEDFVWRFQEDDGENMPGIWHLEKEGNWEHWSPYTNITAAWQVLRKLGNHARITLELESKPDEAQPLLEILFDVDDAPKAICEAANHIKWMDLVIEDMAWHISLRRVRKLLICLKGR